VSRKTSCVSPSVFTPITLLRVVWGLFETIETFLPIILFIRVDLPTLGTPIIAIKADFVEALLESVAINLILILVIGLKLLFIEIHTAIQIYFALFLYPPKMMNNNETAIDAASKTAFNGWSAKLFIKSHNSGLKNKNPPTATENAAQIRTAAAAASLAALASGLNSGDDTSTAFSTAVFTASADKTIAIVIKRAAHSPRVKWIDDPSHKTYAEATIWILKFLSLRMQNQIPRPA